ncbi:MAG: hypothetical protein R3B90_13825 [Planctomycetaceae bacterium]
MKSGRRAKSLPELTVDQAGELLRQGGMRRTLVRVCVLQVLSRQRMAMSQAEVSTALSTYGFDESTIFRSLADMVDRQLIRRVDTGDKTWRFWLRGGDFSGSSPIGPPGGSGRILHVCLKCSRVTPLRAGQLKLEYCGGEISEANVEDIVLRGCCTACEAGSAGGEESADVSESPPKRVRRPRKSKRSDSHVE